MNYTLKQFSNTSNPIIQVLAFRIMMMRMRRKRILINMIANLKPSVFLVHFLNVYSYAKLLMSVYYPVKCQDMSKLRVFYKYIYKG